MSGDSSPPASVVAWRGDSHNLKILQTSSTSGAASPARVSPRVDEQISQCRICFSEADHDAGGELLQPCRCRGTSKYVHSRCLHRWILHCQTRKGVHRALRCDICRATYELPSNFHQNDDIKQRIRRRCQLALTRIQTSPAGPALRSFAGGSWYFASLYGAYHAATRLSEMPAMLMTARHDLSVLRPLLPGFGIAVLVEALATSSDIWFYMETAGFYMAGWLLDASARFLQLNFANTLPAELRVLVSLALLVPSYIGLAFQAFWLSVLSLFSGVAGGFTQGFIHCATAPFKLLAFLGKGSAALLGATVVALMPGIRRST